MTEAEHGVEVFRFEVAWFWIQCELSVCLCVCVCVCDIVSSLHPYEAALHE